MSGIHDISSVDIFTDLSTEQLGKILALCEQINFVQDELIFAENSPSTDIYLILDGEVAVKVDPDLVTSGKELHQPGTIAILRAGYSLGEIALVDQGLRSASAVCHSPTCKAMKIRSQDLLGLLKEDQEMGFIVMTNLARELCLKIRLSNLNLREAFFYLPRKQF